jgi:hypothetical protein
VYLPHDEHSPAVSLQASLQAHLRWIRPPLQAHLALEILFAGPL